jgi:hypothetical protein
LKKRNYRFWVKLGIVLACGMSGASALAQGPSDDTVRVAPPTPSDSLPAQSEGDTLLFVPDLNVSRAAEVTNPADLEKHLTQPPTLALLKSLLLPGLGQLGNRKYFKAVLFGGLETVFIAAAIHYERQASDARELYSGTVNASVRRNWYYFYDNKRKNRNKYIWMAGLTAFVSMFDAYVDAHLSGSPADARNEKFSFEVCPNDDGGMSASLSLNF